MIQCDAGLEGTGLPSLWDERVCAVTGGGRFARPPATGFDAFGISAALPSIERGGDLYEQDCRQPSFNSFCRF